jgi:type VI protein secretion system component VasK
VLPGVRDLKERLDAAVKTSAWSAVAGLAALIMLGFLCAALFLYLQDWRGPIVACLILAGGFLVVVLIAVTAIALVRQRQARLARARAQQANQAAGQWLRDPVVMTTALQVARTLGLRRAAPVLLLGAFVVGLVLSRTAAKTAHPAGPQS